MNWSNEARERLRRVPFFVRGMVSRKVEGFVASQGRSLVTGADLEAVKKQHLQAEAVADDSGRQSEPVRRGDGPPTLGRIAPTSDPFSQFTPVEIRKIQEIASQGERFAGHDTPFYKIRLCAGAFGCPQALADVVGLGDRLRREVEESGLVQWIERTVAGPLLPHHKFKIAVAGCPNACSEPQVRDFGVVAQVEPALELPDLCDVCGDCEASCREEAITLNGKPPVIEFSRCVRCGVCVRACTRGALGEGRRGWQVMVGGKLGRHPRLATVIAELADEESVLALLRASIDFLMANATTPQRLGTLIERNSPCRLIDEFRDKVIAL